MIFQVKCKENVTRRFGPHRLEIDELYFVEKIVAIHSWSGNRGYEGPSFEILGRPGVPYNKRHFVPEGRIIISLPDDIQNVDI